MRTKTVVIYPLAKEHQGQAATTQTYKITKEQLSLRTSQRNQTHQNLDLELLNT